jgi:predicted small lipoprotein YifL
LADLQTAKPFVPAKAGIQRRIPVCAGMSGKVFAVAAVSLALGLAGCGRKAGLDMPPSNTPEPQANLTQPAFGSSALMPGSSQPQPAAHAPNTYDTHGNPIYQPPPANKSFILDPILGPLPPRQ